MSAARRFLDSLRDSSRITGVHRIQVELFGSLSLTGRGHATDSAVLLGLMGEIPETFDRDRADRLLANLRASGTMHLVGGPSISFSESRDLSFREEFLPEHPNCLRFRAFSAAGALLADLTFCSIGGGAIRLAGEAASKVSSPPAPFEFASAAGLLKLGQRHQLPIWRMVLSNESEWSCEAEVLCRLDDLWDAMQDCVRRGFVASGILPGGLHVVRRAPALYARLSSSTATDPLAAMDWLNAFAMAVNEENAAGGRVVTAPTNGAAGVIPAVLSYYNAFVRDSSKDGVHRFLLTAGAIGLLYKANASISGAEVGCQGEVGVACSMAAAGLVAAMNGTNQQVEHAAEIGMEHHLGMTCDPVAGLVQIPCIERNALAAVKALNAVRLAMAGDGSHIVTLDQVIKTMLETGRDMQSRYKETAQGGLAVNVVEC
jgi:L-serine dehydratase